MMSKTKTIWCAIYWGIYTFVCGAPHTCILYYVSKIVDDQFYPLKKKKKRERERKKNDNWWISRSNCCLYYVSKIVDDQFYPKINK